VNALIGRHKFAPAEGVDPACYSGFRVLGYFGPGEWACWQAISWFQQQV
jgi:hypothetical protein